MPRKKDGLSGEEARIQCIAALENTLSKEEVWRDGVEGRALASRMEKVVFGGLGLDCAAWIMAVEESMP